MGRRRGDLGICMSHCSCCPLTGFAIPHNGDEKNLKMSLSTAPLWEPHMCVVIHGTFCTDASVCPHTKKQRG